MGVQFDRQNEILRYYRERGYPTVVGGSYASLCPEQYQELADWVVAGEAEYIWPKFCRDFEYGQPQPLYRETGEVNLHDSPTPRYDLLPLEKYTTVSMQFSRGCPYRCEFCDIIVMFGRRPRVKSLEQISRELDLLRERAVHSVFFVDDNFIGNKKEAKRLLNHLIDYQAEHDYRFSFSTEVSINLAEDEELLRLFRAANFGFVFIGIESPDEGNLRETGKTQNLRQDMLESIRTVYRHGIDVLAGFIVGFDNDDLSTFEQQRRFITASGIQVAMVGLLTALPRTPLHERLQREGRLIPHTHRIDNTKPSTNVRPLRMDYEEMVSAYESLFRHLFTDKAIAERIKKKMRYLRRPAPLEQFSLREQLIIARRLLLYGLMPGGPVRMYRFVRTLLAAPPAAWHQVATDWIVGLSMRQYVKSHFFANPEREQRYTEQTADWLRKRYAHALRQGLIEVSTRLSSGATNLQLVVHGQAERLFAVRVVRRLESLLGNTGATLTLRIEGLGDEHHQQLKHWLQRLSPYGHRVSIWTDDHLRPLLAINSSDFHVLLVRP